MWWMLEVSRWTGISYIYIFSSLNQFFFPFWYLFFILFIYFQQFQLIHVHVCWLMFVLYSVCSPFVRWPAMFLWRWISLSICPWRICASSAVPDCMKSATPWPSSSTTAETATSVSVSLALRTSQVQSYKSTWYLCSFLSQSLSCSSLWMYFIVQKCRRFDHHVFVKDGLSFALKSTWMHRSLLKSLITTSITVENAYLSYTSTWSIFHWPRPLWSWWVLSDLSHRQDRGSIHEYGYHTKLISHNFHQKCLSWCLSWWMDEGRRWQWNTAKYLHLELDP